MADVPVRRSWALPVFAAVAASAAIGFAVLYFIRPNAGELGAIRVVVSDDNGKAGSTVHVIVAEAPFVQKESVSPKRFDGVVQYPTPYLTKPHLKLILGKRVYLVIAETEFGFTWSARPLPEDFKDDAKKGNPLEILIPDTFLVSGITDRLKPNLVLEDFSWEAKGLRMPPSALPPKTHEQSGTFNSIMSQEGPVAFPILYETPPAVELSGNYCGTTIVSDITAKGFKWKNVGKGGTWDNGTVNWKSRGVLAAEKK